MEGDREERPNARSIASRNRSSIVLKAWSKLPQFCSIKLENLEIKRERRSAVKHVLDHHRLSMEVWYYLGLRQLYLDYCVQNNL